MEEVSVVVCTLISEDVCTSFVDAGDSLELNELVATIDVSSISVFVGYEVIMLDANDSEIADDNKDVDTVVGINAVVSLIVPIVVPFVVSLVEAFVDIPLDVTIVDICIDVPCIVKLEKGGDTSLDVKTVEVVDVTFVKLEVVRLVEVCVDIPLDVKRVEICIDVPCAVKLEEGNTSLVVKTVEVGEVFFVKLGEACTDVSVVVRLVEVCVDIPLDVMIDEICIDVPCVVKLEEDDTSLVVKTGEVVDVTFGKLEEA